MNSASFRQSRRKLALAAVATAAALALTACGGDASTPAAEDEPEGPIAMTVARGQVNIEMAILADEQGFFDDAGLDVTLEVSQGATATNSAVISGEFDIAMTEGMSAVRAMDEGMPITIVAGGRTLLADPAEGQAEGVLLPPGSDITTWSDFEGRRIGVSDLGGIGNVRVC